MQCACEKCDGIDACLIFINVDGLCEREKKAEVQSSNYCNVFRPCHLSLATFDWIPHGQLGPNQCRLLCAVSVEATASLDWANENFK